MFRANFIDQYKYNTYRLCAIEKSSWNQNRTMYDAKIFSCQLETSVGPICGYTEI